ncbi:50S ribosomal protein L18 [candidate division KSB1 bacterium]|nr:50S ribosomal protein L18 [candidate division KSB1 bacterium]
MNKSMLQRVRRRLHIRKKILGSPERPRLVVFRSNKHIYAQLIDDLDRRTLLTVSTLSKDIANDVDSAENKSAQARLVGKLLAEKAKENKIEQVVFDRAGYLYHGRVKALADAAREGGLDF